MNHQLQLKSSHYLPLNEDSIPVGHKNHAEETAFDFTKHKRIGDGVQTDGVQTAEQQINIVGGGYDHPFVLDSNFDKEIILTDPVYGRRLTIETDQKSVVFYSGNHLSQDTLIRGGASHKQMALCLETQNYPNAINESAFPSIGLQPSERYFATTRYIFTTC